MNTANQMIMHPEFGWVVDMDNNPLYGWPLKKVFATNPCEVPKYDLYGRLYFYIVDKLSKFVAVLKSGRVHFHMYNEDAVKLFQKFEETG